MSVFFCIWNAELFFPYISRETAASEFTSFIPHRDRKRLEYFFRRLIFWDSCGYVLMGGKPCAAVPFQRPGCFRFVLPSNVRFWLGWETWKRYEKNFPHPAFSIFEEREENGTSWLILIHNSALIDTLLSYRAEFENLLPEPIASAPPLDEATFKPLFGRLFKNNDFLFGLVLGFGTHNSWVYAYREAKDDPQMVPLAAEEACSFSEWIRACGVWGFVSGSLFRDLSRLPLPGFMVDPDDPETIQLKSKYSAIRQKIIEYYNQKNFLDATLTLLQSY